MLPQRSRFGKQLLFAKRSHFSVKKKVKNGAPFSMEKRLHLEKGGAKIVPQRGLFCGQKRYLRGAILAPLFFLSDINELFK